LKKLRLNYHNELHLTQHNRDKSLTLAETLKQHNLNLRKKLKTQRVLRERLYKAKMERERIRKRHSEKRITVNELKETISHLNEQISVFEARFSGSINSNFIK